MIIINKPPGYTINQIIKKYKKDNNIKKLCYCGRLDPMAQGKLLLLIDNECKQMPLYLKKNKTYMFEIIFGLQTDTDDPLGIIEKMDNSNQKEKLRFINSQLKKIGGVLNRYNKLCFVQKFHNYSSKTINGKPLWYYKKNNINIKQPEHQVEIFNITKFNIKKYNFNNWKNNIIKQINSIDKSKDFNQENIIKQWESINLNIIYSLPIEISVSSGFYIRQFVRDISNKINYPLLTFDINRISIE